MSDSDLILFVGGAIWLFGFIVIGNRTLARLDGASTQVAWVSSLRFGYLASLTGALLWALPWIWESVMRPWVARPDSGEILFFVFFAAVSGPPFALGLHLQYKARSRRRTMPGA